MSDITVAALYVQRGGVYWDLPGVDAWDEQRDARNYRGPWPVVAHPPCKRWGRYWSGGPSARTRRLLGDDDGCFAHALWAVRTFGGVLEHPEASKAWLWFGLERPTRGDGWGWCDEFGGRSCCVEQGHYGHRARKATWLYAVAWPLPGLEWSPSVGERLDEGFHSTRERNAARESGMKPRRRLSAAENLSTPIPFRDMLLRLARGARKEGGRDE